jgi:flagellar biosynthesis/type III secretory pathway chaperone
MTTTPDNCRQSLHRLLQQETSAMQKLSVALQAEHNAILGRDTDALEQIVGEKLLAVNLVVELEQERTSLMESAGYRASTDGMLHLLKWCDRDDQLSAAWQQLLSIAGECREQNRLNHQQAEISSRYIHQALCVLRGEDPGRTTYGPDGDTGEQHRSRSLVRA